MKRILSAVMIAAMIAVMIAVGIPAAAGADFYATAELLEIKEHIESDAGMNEYATVQGACTDGHYAYFAVQQNSTTILKYDLNTWELEDWVEDLDDLDHANDMTYNTKNNWILVANNEPHYNILTILNPVTFKKIKTVKLKIDIYSIAYNPKKDIYVAGISGGYQFAILNNKFKVIKKYKGKETGYTRQGCDCDENYIYFSQSGGDNVVAVYDYNGKYVDMVSIGHSHEVENIFHVDTSFYTTLHFYGNSVQRIGFSDRSRICYTVNYIANGGRGVMNPTVVHYGEGTPLRKNAFVKAGYFFGGWRASRSSDGKYLGFRKFSRISEWLDQESVYQYDMYADGDSVAETVKFGSVTMSPFWISETYDVSFDPGDSESGSMASQTVRHYDTYQIPENQFDKPGYIFVGYTAYRDYDDKYYGYRRGCKEAEWLYQEDLIKVCEFKPGESFSAMTYGGTVYLKPVFRFAYTFSDDQSALLEYIGIDEVVNIPNPSGNLNTIATGAFRENHHFTEIHIPETVERIETGAVNDCNRLERIYFKNHFPTHFALKSILRCDNPAMCLEYEGQTYLLGYAAGTVDAQFVRINAAALRGALSADHQKK